MLELGVERPHILKRSKDGCFFGSNFPETETLMRLRAKFDPTKKDSSPNARKRGWQELISSHKEKLTWNAKSFENDEFDVCTRTTGANERTLCGRVEFSRAAFRNGTGLRSIRGEPSSPKSPTALWLQDVLLGPDRSRRIQLSL